MNAERNPVRVLMILHYFPPSQAIPAIRARRFVRHFPELGVEPVVVTASRDGKADATRRIAGIGEEEVDGVPVRVVRVRGSDFLGRFRRVPGTGTPARSVETHRMKGLKRLVKSLMIPDESRGWIDAWVDGGLAAAKKGVDVVYSTSVPFSAHLAAQRLSARLNAPWILEMRDLWSDSPYIPQAGNPLLRNLQRRHETRSLDAAAKIVVTTEAHKRHLVEKSLCSGDRIEVVPNAFDPNPVNPGRPPRGPLRLFHPGVFYGGRSLAHLGRAVDAVEGQLPGFDSAVLEVAGRTLDRPWEDVLAGTGRNRKIHGVLPHARVHELYGEVHAGIVHFPSGDRTHVPAKLYEFLGSGLPVLDLTSQPDIPSLCEGTVPCWKVPSTDPSALGRALHELASWWAEHPEGLVLPGPDHPFAARSVASKLASVMKECAS